jgi:hypothetical protein
VNARVWFLAALGLCGLAAQSNADLAQVQSVYILPMSGGMHQHLTNRLVKLGLFQVVADPHRADTVLTDRLGAAFETQLTEWDQIEAQRNPPPPPPVKPEAAKEEGDDSKPLELASRQVTAAISRGKGTLFLVDRRSRKVLWSTYQRSKSTQPDELERTAGRVADRLKEEWGGKKK